ncbi:MAG: glycoside hydrolase family 43 protein [Pontiellaceae bacterium]|nr:glycoside hydrolase family 43 protein [Pontiellaceae bacterium]
MNKRTFASIGLMGLAAALSGCQLMKQEPLVYSNPLWDGYLADPAVLQYDGEWYAYGTGKNEATGYHFPVLHSTDFVHWVPEGYIMPPLDNPAMTEYWAPEVVEKDGTFYLYYAGDLKMRVAKSNSPLGPFEDCGELLFPQWEFSIDAHPFKDPDSGEWYLFFARDFLDVDRVGTGISVVKLGDDMISVTGPIETVATAIDDWQIYERNRSMYGGVYDWHTVEGPWVVKKDGLYYCFWSGSNWQSPDYGVGFSVAETPMGPWRDGGNKAGASVLNGKDNNLIGPGHCSVTLAPDGKTHFMVYHSWNPEHTRRVMCMDPIEWTGKGPKVKNPAFGVKAEK